MESRDIYAVGKEGACLKADSLPKPIQASGCVADRNANTLQGAVRRERHPHSRGLVIEPFKPGPIPARGPKNAETTLETNGAVIRRVRSTQYKLTLKGLIPLSTLYRVNDQSIEPDYDRQDDHTVHHFTAEMKGEASEPQNQEDDRKRPDHRHTATKHRGHPRGKGSTGCPRCIYNELLICNNRLCLLHSWLRSNWW
jgi:hypothetical protein